MLNKIPVMFIVVAFSAQAHAQTGNAYTNEIDNWHKQREENLKNENGWLNLVGLIWLQQGKQSFGDGDDVQIKFPAGTITHHAGFFELKNYTVTLYADDSTNILVNGNPVKQAIIFSPDSLKPINCSYGTLRWTIIKRDDKIGIRLRDVNSELVKNFKGIERFAVDSAYKVKAWLKKPETSFISITNILGQTNKEETAGKLVFTLQGKEYSLDALQEGKALFIVFADATSGKETYPSGRFLTASLPGADGSTILDFNKAYNPPCAFTPYATCPLPPEQNRLKVAIPAGEKNYKRH
ncbi:DUF1684 domain-containing protein [Parafilimonas sp.]|uniref:DUF1684 domain-containing protein n=1 Tax=Parafilimonas sp. TaxID=1969739 RepID=UPI0039E2D57D